LWAIECSSKLVTFHHKLIVGHRNSNRIRGTAHITVFNTPCNSSIQQNLTHIFIRSSLCNLVLTTRSIVKELSIGIARDLHREKIGPLKTPANPPFEFCAIAKWSTIADVRRSSCRANGMLMPALHWPAYICVSPYSHRPSASSRYPGCQGIDAMAVVTSSIAPFSNLGGVGTGRNGVHRRGRRLIIIAASSA
jgi:hypothetical protein